MKKANLLTTATALEAVRKEFPDKYVTVELKVSVHKSDKEPSQECKIYVEGCGSFEAKHWHQALTQLRDHVTNKSENIPNVTY